MLTKIDNPNDFKLAWKILNTHHGEVDDFFKFWPPDKTYFFASDKNAFVAYGIKRRVAICLGDPVGSDKSVALLLKEFEKYCASRNLTIAFIQSTNRCKKADPSDRLRHVLIGADAVVNLKHFNSTTVHNKYFRNIVNRFEKHDFSFSTHQPPHSKALLKELARCLTVGYNFPTAKSGPS